MADATLTSNQRALPRYKVIKDRKDEYCLKACDDGDLTEYSDAAAEIDRLTALVKKAGDLLTYGAPDMDLQSDDGSDWIDKCDEWFKAADYGMPKTRGADTSTAALGPREPDNSMVICPNCTCQFGAISVNDQAERRRLERVERAWHFVQNCPQDEPLRNALQQAFMRDFKGSSPDEPGAEHG